jgi:hypothetical protein
VFLAGELLFPPPSTPSERLLYASNRNINGRTRRQHIKYTSRANPTLVVVNQMPTGLREVEGMAFSDDGQYLIGGAGRYVGIRVFEGQVESEGGREKRRHYRFVVACRGCA